MSTVRETGSDVAPLLHAICKGGWLGTPHQQGKRPELDEIIDADSLPKFGLLDLRSPPSLQVPQRSNRYRQ
jgi:hypothetical protein